MALTGAEHGPLQHLFDARAGRGRRLLQSFPYVFVFTKSALDLVSSEMEDAANILGAGTLRTTFRVTLPLVLPAIVGGLIIVVPRSDRAVRRAGADRAAGALPGGVDAALAVLRIPGAGRAGRGLRDAAAADHDLLFWLQRRVLGRNGYTTVSGKGGERRMIAARAVALARCSAMRCSSARSRSSCRCWCLPGGASPRPGGAASARQSDAAKLPLHPVRARPQAHNAIINTFVYSGVRGHSPLRCRCAIAYMVTRKLVPWSATCSPFCAWRRS